MIDTGRGVALGPLEQGTEGAEKYRQWRNDYRVWKWCRQNTVIDSSQHRRWLDRCSTDSSLKMFEICIPGHGKVGELDNRMFLASDRIAVGVCGFTDIDRVNQRAEFSLYIAPKYQREGYATAALQTLLDHGFLHQNFNCIWGESFDGNPAIELFKKIGFKEEGRRRQFYYREGMFIDAVLVSVLKEEWEHQRSSHNRL